MSRALRETIAELHRQLAEERRLRQEAQRLHRDALIEVERLRCQQSPATTNRAAR